jgi:intracellular sulfur oxidation DsrE/DsrF family protein
MQSWRVFRRQLERYISNNPSSAQDAPRTFVRIVFHGAAVRFVTASTLSSIIYCHLQHSTISAGPFTELSVAVQ